MPLTEKSLKGAVIGYPKGGVLQTYEGRPIPGLRLEVVSSWATPHSWVGPRMYAYRATDADGNRYHGRGFGDGMLLVLRPDKRRGVFNWRKPARVLYVEGWGRTHRDFRTLTQAARYANAMLDAYEQTGRKPYPVYLEVLP